MENGKITIVIQRRRNYLVWAENVISGLRGVNPKLEKLFDERLKEGRIIFNKE